MVYSPNAKSMGSIPGRCTIPCLKHDHHNETAWASVADLIVAGQATQHRKILLPLLPTASLEEYKI